MSVLALHHSNLRCTGNCLAVLVERYPILPRSNRSIAQECTTVDLIVSEQLATVGSIPSDCPKL